MAALVPWLVATIVLATSMAQPDFPADERPRPVIGRWIVNGDERQDEQFDGASPEPQTPWPYAPFGGAGLFPMEDQPTTPSEPYVMKEQDSELAESSVWKVFLVVSILLMTAMASLSVGYYLCVWRGGRIHYEPQRELSTMI